MKWFIAGIVLVALLAAVVAGAGPPKWRPMSAGDDEMIVMVAGKLVFVVQVVMPPASMQGPSFEGPPLCDPPPAPPPPGPPKVKVGTEP